MPVTTAFVPAPPAAPRLARQLELGTPRSLIELDGHELHQLRFDDEAPDTRDHAGVSDVCEWNIVRVRACALGDFDLSGSFLTDVVFDGCDLANVSARAVNWRRVMVTDSRLTGAMLGEGRFRDVEFRDCRLDISNLRDARFERVRFVNCDLTGVLFARGEFKDVEFESCTFERAELHHMQLVRTRFASCELGLAQGINSLTGAWIGLSDVLAMAPALARACGIVIPPEENL
ncbi:MAG: pentapeptide repeat-containing protein [Thermoleophilia bacterium]|nr:pentapeptide repeat-containing protein [Thermoleophilia bacterium]